MTTKLLVIVSTITFFIGFALAAVVCAQERIVDKNTVERILPNGQVQAHIRANQNYLDATTGTFKRRDVKFTVSQTLPGKVVYREGHNVVLDTLSGYVNMNIGGTYVTFTPRSTQLPEVARGKARVNYHAIWKNVDYDIQLTPEGTKETITLLNDKASLAFQFSAEFGAVPEVGADGITAGALLIPKPTAVDANENEVPVQWSLSDPVAGIYTYTMTVDTACAAFPIVIDPTIIIKPDATAGKDTWVNEANTSQNNGTGTTILVDNTRSSDGLIQFDVSSIPGAALISSVTCSLNVVTYTPNGTPAAGAREIIYAPIAATWAEGTVTWANKPDSIINATDTSMFNFGSATGWKVLVDTDTTSGIGRMVNRWIKGVSTNYGWELKTNGTTHPTNYIEWSIASSDNATAGNWPSLTIVYTVPDTIFAPYNISTGGSGTGEVRVIFTDSSTVTKYIKLHRSDLSVVDSVRRTGITKTDTMHWTGLVPGNSYDFYLSVIGVAGGDSNMTSGSGTAGTGAVDTTGAASRHGIVRRIEDGRVPGRVGP